MLIDRAEIQRVLPGYEIGGQIGRGGFGLVFTARHRRLEVTRAVKVIVNAQRKRDVIVADRTPQIIDPCQKDWP